MKKSELRKYQDIKLGKAIEKIKKGNLIKLEYPKTKSESEIQSLLYLELLKNNFHARLEVNGFSSSKCRFDVVIFHPKRNIIIEVKKKITKKQHAKQRDKYILFDAELLFCYGEKDISLTINKIKNILS